jgi:hypothetical protein
MNISQALKEKNKKAHHIKKLVERVVQINVQEEGQERTYSSKALLDEAKKELSALVNLKTAIHKASAPVREKIFRLSELKGFVKQLEYLSTETRVVKNRTDGAVIGKHVAEITTKEHEEFLKATNNEIDKIQEELDAFNHTTSV